MGFCFFTPVIEAAAELPAGGAKEEGEPLGLQPQPAATTDRLPPAGERSPPRRGKFCLRAGVSLWVEVLPGVRQV